MEQVRPSTLCGGQRYSHGPITHTFPHRQTGTKMKHTPLATSEVGQATEVSVDERNTQGGRSRHTHTHSLCAHTGFS